jgi:pimeloyl-ACP methyl ester carboxylesterase
VGARPRRISVPVAAGILSVEEAGPARGPLVVLLHGFPQTTASWDGVVPRLAAAGMRVLAPLQRGYSPRARPTAAGEYGIQALAADVLGVADAAGADRFSVVGHDWGGAVAWWLGANAPERIVTVTSLATPHPAAMARAALRSTQVLRSLYIPFFRLPAVPERVLLARGGVVLERALRSSGLDVERSAAYVDAMRQPGTLTAALNWYRAASPRTLGRLGRVTRPTLYLWGNRDTALGRAAAQATASHVTGPYRFVELDAPHWLPELEPEHVAGLVQEHLEAHDGS